MSNLGSRLRNTANIHFKDYDHKDVIAVWPSKGTPGYTPKYDRDGEPTCINQIVVVDENGEAKRIWSKIYDELLLSKAPYFWVFYDSFYLLWSSWSYSHHYMSGFLFPEYYKNVTACGSMMPWQISGSASGPTGTYSIKNSLIISCRGWGYGSGNFGNSKQNMNTGEYTYYEDVKDMYCQFSVSPDGINSYMTTKIKLYDRLGWKNPYVSGWKITKHGFYYFYQRLSEGGTPGSPYAGDNKYWISYMTFDRETRHFGDPVDFNLNLQDILGVPQGSYLSVKCFTIDDYLFYFTDEHEYPNNDPYLYRTRIHFVRISPTGDVRHIYTRWYSFMTYFSSSGGDYYITCDENYAYFNMVTQNVYTNDNSCPMMASIYTIDKYGNINIIHSEKYTMVWNSNYGRWEHNPTKMSAIVNSTYCYKNVHSDWWYFYSNPVYSNKAFMDFDDYNENDPYHWRWIVARTTDFIHFEFYQTPKEIITYHAQIGNLSKKVTYKSEKLDWDNNIYPARMLSYNPEPLSGDMGHLYPVCLHNGKLAHTSGHFITTDYSGDYPGMMGQGFIYLKNYACMPNNEDTWYIQYDTEYTYDHQILDLINGVDVPGG